MIRPGDSGKRQVDETSGSSTGGDTIDAWMKQGRVARGRSGYSSGT